jgi:GDP-L-fucose synthase
MQTTGRICVAGHRGLVGVAILCRLDSDGAPNVVTATREQLDLRYQAAAELDSRGDRE